MYCIAVHSICVVLFQKQMIDPAINEHLESVMEGEIWLPLYEGVQLNFQQWWISFWVNLFVYLDSVVFK